jgi:hypothetical protein
MITLNKQTLEFSFLNIHPEACLGITFKRTLRVPDDGNRYPLPADLGDFPVFHTEDFAQNIPDTWSNRGGVIIPMYQKEALWIDFGSMVYLFGGNNQEYPCAIKIGTGKICAITGQQWSNELSQSLQNYVVFDQQPWLDGYRIDSQTVRQFVAMPLGEGYTTEEQISHEANYGGIQIMVIPMKREYYEKHVNLEQISCHKHEIESNLLGLSPGGKISQKIYEDSYGVEAWDIENSARCFVHTVNSEQFETITGLCPPASPITREKYIEQAMPWYEYYSDAKALKGVSNLGKLSSVAQKHLNNHWDVLSGNQSMPYEKVVKLQGQTHD